jgi:gamma-glutamyl-gamma-aminobutyrate hydrolase PuuD
MAAISLETLLGGDLMSDITRSLAQRGAMLTARGEDAVRVYKQLKKLYRVRSKLVHEGKPPMEEQLVNIHRFLMHALPSMTALIQMVGTHKQALDLLDESLLARRTDVDNLFEAVHRWWDYVPTASFAP